jgi:hypothetical protein
MGANAQTAVPTFSASQVLTAAQQNNSARTGVPVFASTTTRNAAFGGSNKTLAEGQLCYVEGTGLQTYNGTAWVTWGAAPTSGGLVYLTGATFTTQTTVSLPTDTFNTTYRNYRAIFDITAATTTGNITGRFRTAGADITTSRYFQMSTGIDFNGTGANQNDANTTAFTLGTQGSSTIPFWSWTVDFIAPQVSSVRKTVMGNLQFFNGTSLYIGRQFGGVLDTTGAAFQCDSFTIISSSASSITGRYRVYGYADS